MATNSHIGIINTDGSVDIIYCHWDGYPSHHAPILLNHYNTIDKVQELVQLGDISSLEQNISPNTDTHSFDKPEPNVVVAYHRDRGEDWNGVKPRHYTDKKELIDANCLFGDVYLFDSNKEKWTYSTGKRFVELKDPAQKNKKG